jgi:hypothetical protein
MYFFQVAKEEIIFLCQFQSMHHALSTSIIIDILLDFSKE